MHTTLHDREGGAMEPGGDAEVYTYLHKGRALRKLPYGT
jgi:hypothetical protein